MLGERSDQRGLWEADRLYLDHVGWESFYGLLASMRGRLFRDADFAEFYCPDNGRDSVPPSLLATALLLQSHDKVSDAEAKARADFDLRWKVALGIEAEDRPFAKSTLQVFRRPASLEKGVAVRTLTRNPGQENPFAEQVTAAPWTSRARRGCTGQWRGQASSTTPIGYGSGAGGPPSTRRWKTPECCLTRRLGRAWVG